MTKCFESSPSSLGDYFKFKFYWFFPVEDFFKSTIYLILAFFILLYFIVLAS